MAGITPRNLIDKLNNTCRNALMSAAGLCLSKTHFNVEIEHWMVKLFELPNTDLPVIFKQYEANLIVAKREMEAALGRFKTGNGRPPELSFEVLDLIREAWVFASLEYGAQSIRSGYLLSALLNDRTLGLRMRASVPELARIPADKLQKEVHTLLQNAVMSEESQDLASGDGVVSEAGTPAQPGDPAKKPSGSSKTPSLDQFTVNLTENAKTGKLDPVVGRDNEIRQVIDILTRRRQNNPILIGEAGVGKTAVVEGLALRIAAGDVPGPLKNVILRILDLGLLQAGAGMKGEFENRLKGVIAEVKASPQPIILFVDEAHTLIGAGGQAGQGDAANLLKPALARGELRTIAATTYAEYKKYFETDAALKRRFQPVKVDEPDEVKAVRMLRGLTPMLEKHHGVRILESALTDVVRLSTRYIPERQLPDKAVSLLDTVCARVNLSQSATPPSLEDVKREIEHLEAEQKYQERETTIGHGNAERLQEIAERLTVSRENMEKLTKQHGEEQTLVKEMTERRKLLEAPPKDIKPEALEKAKVQLAELRDQLTKLQGETPLIYPTVDGAAVAEVVAGLTGIPLGKMVRNEIDTLLNLHTKLSERVVGQDHALHAIAERIRTARADLVDPKRPIGVFLLVGPSGVGKTETAMALADLLYGGDRNMVIINMSEYKESAKISRLTGTAKGYVGYGEGGVLTNAVKRRPYSVVLLDEIEKADESVQEIFYQVFDKGSLQNDDGEEINFKNTIILLTSNVGTDTIMKACADPETIPNHEGLAQIMRPDLLKSFKPALLGRMTVVPYFPLSEPILKQIIELNLRKISDRLRTNHKAKFEYTPKVVDTIASRCKEVESGARNVDHIITGTLLPRVSREVLTRLGEGHPVKHVKIDIDDAGAFSYHFE
jgi:type VI secretion system protein VasG